VHDCGFIARCSLATDDSAQVRVNKIHELIADCRLGIHDISRTELDPVSNLPRFNMPLELGMFLGARRYGSPKQQRKLCLILDRERYRFQSFISDIGGQDVKSHGKDVASVIRVVRDWLRHASEARKRIVPGGPRMYERYQEFLGALPAICSELNLDSNDLMYNDYTTLVVGWLRQHSW